MPVPPPARVYEEWLVRRAYLIRRGLTKIEKLLGSSWRLETSEESMEENSLSLCWKETMDAIRGIDIVPVKLEGGDFFQGIVITFRLSPPAAFHAKLLDGLRVELVLGRSSLAPVGTRIKGRLSLGSLMPTLGLKRHIRFNPDRIEDLEQIAFTGRNFWSNVEKLQFTTPIGECALANAFCHEVRLS